MSDATVSEQSARAKPKNFQLTKAIESKIELRAMPTGSEKDSIQILTFALSLRGTPFKRRLKLLSSMIG